MTIQALLLPGLRAKPSFLLTQLGRQRFAEILRIEDLPDLDFGAAVERRALHPFNRLLQRFRLNKPEPCDKIAGHGERTMAHAALFSGIFDPGAFRRRMQALARQHDARFHHLLVELAHCRQHFRARHHAGFAVLIGLYNHHESHRHAPFSIQKAGCEPALIHKTNRVLRHRHVLRNYFGGNCAPGAALATPYRKPLRAMGSAFALPDEGAVLTGGAEIDIDAFDLVALEAEEFGIAKILAAFGHTSIGHNGLITFDENSFELMPFNPVGDPPAAHKISGLVDLVVIRAGEMEVVSERVFNGLTVIRQISCEQSADGLRLALRMHVNHLHAGCNSSRASRGKARAIPTAPNATLNEPK